MNAHLATVHTQEVLASATDLPLPPPLKAIHPQHPPTPAPPPPQPVSTANSCVEDDLPLGATFETTFKKASASQLPTVITQMPSPPKTPVSAAASSAAIQAA